MHTGVIFNLLINTLTHTHTHTHTHTQLVMGEEAVLTFSCTSVVEREEWTEAFRVLNQLAQPCGNPQQVTLPITGEEGERGEGRRWEGERGEGRRWEGESWKIDSEQLKYSISGDKDIALDSHSCFCTQNLQCQVYS